MRGIFDNDKLLHWCVGPIFGWALWGFVIGVPLHILFGISGSSIAKWVVIQCALQITAMFFMFSARATKEKPRGLPLRAAAIAIVWFTAGTLATFFLIFGPDDYADRAAVISFFGTPIVFCVLGLVALRVFSTQIELFLIGLRFRRTNRPASSS